MDKPRDREDLFAEILNGAMLVILGSIIPAALIWGAAADWQTILAGRHSMTRSELGQGIASLFVSVTLLWLGIRILRRTLPELRRV